MDDDAMQTLTPPHSHSTSTSASASGVTKNALRPKPKMNNACEACRAAKVKCQPSVHAGICRRCLEFKRECVFRTGPRTRRPRQSKLNQDVTPRPPLHAPSKTFSINFDMPAPEEPSPSSFESLASRHASYIESLLPKDNEHTPMFDDLVFDAISSFHHPGGIALTPPHSHYGAHHGARHSTRQIPHHDAHAHAHSSSSHGASSHGASSHGSSSHGSSSHHASPHSTSSSSGHSHSPHATISMSTVGLKPQFNLNLAASLLTSFRRMLPHFPCIVLPDDATVPSLAKSRPFVLLAILSVASGAASLQGHTLYDEEFRKVLGLKFVAGGERSLELLQGLLIYTAWYPFHLRPKNKQAFQYVRMAAEIAHDLDLVGPPPGAVVDADADADAPISPEQIDGMRTYLACFYLMSSFFVTWVKFTAVGLEHTAWTATCCDVLERRSPVPSDQTLAWFVRFANIIETTHKLDYLGPEGSEKSRDQARLMLLGLESQFNEWRARIPRHLLSHSLGLSILTTFTDLYLHAAPIHRFAPPCTGPRTHLLSAEAPRLRHCLPVLRALLDTLAALPAADFAPLATSDWGKIIQVTILSLRLSFPLAACPSWDDAAARAVLDFGGFLDRFAGDDAAAAAAGGAPAGAEAPKIDVLTASKLVFGIVRAKYRGRLAKLETPETTLARGARGCPMLDGTLDGYFPAWDPDLTAPAPGGLWLGESRPWDAGLLDDEGSSVQDVWSTMTLEWPAEGDGTGAEMGMEMFNGEQ
ncbi:Transcription factor himD like protein [Verticillium longisporum]|uniref:Transcription factor himD like protein n=1 Tax=Verticillium longisporum TaxID=100787 RepID=A0A8I2Z3E6_VERLO|nr:Transcription factor himD like protein [Verticillium longisporum]